MVQVMLVPCGLVTVVKHQITGCTASTQLHIHAGSSCKAPGTTLLQLQIACAMAAEGAELVDIAREASKAAAALGSCGVATTVCSVPGAQPSHRVRFPTPAPAEAVHYAARSPPARCLFESRSSAVCGV